jgi:hypothetical protein
MNPTQKVAFAATRLNPFHGAVERVKHRLGSLLPRRIQVLYSRDDEFLWVRKDDKICGVDELREAWKAS